MSWQMNWEKIPDVKDVIVPLSEEARREVLGELTALVVKQRAITLLAEAERQLETARAQVRQLETRLEGAQSVFHTADQNWRKAEAARLLAETTKEVSAGMEATTKAHQERSSARAELTVAGNKLKAAQERVKSLEGMSAALRRVISLAEDTPCLAIVWDALRAYAPNGHKAQRMEGTS